MATPWLPTSRLGKPQVNDCTALSGAGSPSGAMAAVPEVQCLPPQRQTSDLASSTPAKSRSRWQRERLVALRPVLASWTCFSLSGSAGLPVVSSGMKLLGGAGKLGARGFQTSSGVAQPPSPLFPPLGPLLPCGSPRLLAGSPGQNRGALVKQ